MSQLAIGPETAQAIEALIAAEGLPDDYREVVDQHWTPLADRIGATHPRVVGINGAQGSGKSTLARFLEPLLAARGLRAVTLALDDLYLPRAERLRLAAEVHPLFATRGVPGTHDAALGSAIIEDLVAGRPTRIPRFDKASDDRAAEWREVAGPVDVVLFEGWCVGARPQSETALVDPFNRLEAQEDAERVWRLAVNHHLAGDYATLFGHIDDLVMLRVPSFSVVRANRLRQEEKLALSNPGGSAIMDAAALDRFVQHYERLTRWMLGEMPDRADVLIPIGFDQRPL